MNNFANIHHVPRIYPYLSPAEENTQCNFKNLKYCRDSSIRSLSGVVNNPCLLFSVLISKRNRRKAKLNGMDSLKVFSTPIFVLFVSFLFLFK